MIDMIGKLFGRLTVLRDVGCNSRRERMYLCRCECGGTRRVRGTRLRSGVVADCGCSYQVRRHDIARRANWKHGMSRGSTYSSWHAMMGRCTSRANRSWKNYGGRGITVCQRWHSFLNFVGDLGERPEGTELDRIDVNGNYEPGNCRWVTRSANFRNKRNNRTLTVEGKTLTIAEWAERTGIRHNTIAARLRRGCTAAEALQLA